MNGAKIKEGIALLAIGDGVLTALQPRRHLALWTGGPGWYRKAMRQLAAHENLTRALGVLGVVGAVAWAARQRP